MRNLLVGCIAIIAMVGCVQIDGDTVGTEIRVDNNSSYTVDNSVTNVTCRDNTDTNCYTAGREGFIDKNGTYNDVSPTIDGPFDASDDPATCSAKGYFYCSVNHVCVNTSADSGSCSK